MFLDLNDIYECLNYIINLVDLIKVIKEESIYFDEKDYQYCYYFFYVLNFNFYFSLNTQKLYYYSNNFKTIFFFFFINF